MRHLQTASRPVRSDELRRQQGVPIRPSRGDPGGASKGSGAPVAQARGQLRAARKTDQRSGGVARADLDAEVVRHRGEIAVRESSHGAPQGPPAPGASRRSSGQSGRPDASENAPGQRSAPPRRPLESSVMRDAREVEAGRKRQLGRGRP
jgi:hypothetical protein